MHTFVSTARGSNQTTKTGFFWTFSERGGRGSRRFQNFLNRKNSDFFGLFAERGGGLTQSKRVFSRKLGTITKKSFFGYLAQNWFFCGYFAQFSAKTLLDWVRPPFGKKISVFSVKEILDSTRPPPLSGNVKKNPVFFYCSPK